MLELALAYKWHAFVLCLVGVNADYLITLRGMRKGFREGNKLYLWVARKTGWTVQRAVHVVTGATVFLAAALMAWGYGEPAVPWQSMTAFVIFGGGGLARLLAAFRNWKIAN